MQDAIEAGFARAQAAGRRTATTTARRAVPGQTSEADAALVCARCRAPRPVLSHQRLSELADAAVLSGRYEIFV